MARGLGVSLCLQPTWLSRAFMGLVETAGGLPEARGRNRSAGEHRGVAGRDIGGGVRAVCPTGGLQRGARRGKVTRTVGLSAAALLRERRQHIVLAAALTNRYTRPRCARKSAVERASSLSSGEVARAASAQRVSSPVRRQASPAFWGRAQPPNGMGERTDEKRDHSCTCRARLASARLQL